MNRVAVMVVAVLSACDPGSPAPVDGGDSSPPPCLAGSRKCDGDNITGCAEDGVSYIVLEVCPMGCDSGGGSPVCRTCACTPGNSRCVAGGEALEQCSSDCLAWTVIPCDEGSTCRTVSGASSSAACEACPVSPNERCDGQNIVRIDASCDETLVETCEFGCDEQGCRDEPVCTPNAVRCDGNQKKTCNAIGSYEASETCEFVCVTTGSGPACVACHPGRVRCLNASEAVRCSEDGSGETALTVCGTCTSDSEGVGSCSEG